MKFVSTRDSKNKYSLSDAIKLGLAADGGLFVPEQLPKYNIGDFDGLHEIDKIAYEFLLPFFRGDDLESDLNSICLDTFNFPIPLTNVNDKMALLELYHGPTGAFKDIGARFLARCFERMNKKITILVATSGDTGSAVASAFHKLENIKVIILFPRGKISEFQESQLTCWDDNILSLKVNGDFDDCQRIVKEAFNNEEQKEKYQLSSANSINIGRLLPQCVYYVASSLWYFREHGCKPSYIIPVGNMGNSLACIWVRSMGFPIDEIILTSNANRVIPDYFSSGKYEPRESMETLANAMDVGAPSNFERFRHLNQESEIELRSYSISDYEIKQTIKEVFLKWDLIICPHTATAFAIGKQLVNDRILVATAHPSKFKDIVQPLVNREVVFPKNIEHFITTSSSFGEIQASLEDLYSQIDPFVEN